MVLDNLGSSLKDTLKKIAGLGVVDKEAVQAILRDLQRALLQADVDVALVSELSNKIKKKVLEEKPPAGLTLKEYFIKIFYDEIVAFLGEEKGEIELKKQRILLIGLFGSGKTSTCGKLAKWFKVRGLKPGLVACDTHRAAAQEQLRQLAKKIEVPVYFEGGKPEKIAEKALKSSKEDILIFDSAGRDALDNNLTVELKNLAGIINPNETLLILPADIGQAARKQSEEFNKHVGITGIIVTKLDGTARGGGALAATSVSGAKVRMIGIGEKLENLEVYDPKRFVSRLIGYGDIQGLLEKAKEVGVGEDKESMERLLEGKFTLDDFLDQIKNMQKMGPLNKVAEMIPGFSGLKLPQDFMNIQEDKMKKWKHCIQSMTSKERQEPELIKANRIKRIAKGSGASEGEVRELLKQYKQIKKIMKMTKGGKGLKRGPLANLAKQFGFKM